MKGNSSKNRQIGITILGLVIVLIMMIGATYAYFAAYQIYIGGTSAKVSGKTKGSDGVATLLATGNGVTIKLASEDMFVHENSKDDVHYYSINAKYCEEKAINCYERDFTKIEPVKLLTASITGNQDAYNCSYKIKVTDTNYGEKNNMLIEELQDGDGVLVLTGTVTGKKPFNGNVILTELYGSMKDNGYYEYEGEINNLTPNKDVDFTAYLQITNTNVKQDYMENKELSLLFEPTEFKCTATN